MSILFLDLESIPTPEALEAAGGSTTSRFKTLSLSACTARVLCLGYAVGDAEGEIVAFVLGGSSESRAGITG